ncbi:hypothetical protein CR513_39737, partial [Mucuna pruriens]
MTRSSFDILYELDPKIDRTLRRLRIVRSFEELATNDFDLSKYSSSDINLDLNLVVRVGHARCGVPALVHPVFVTRTILILRIEIRFNIFCCPNFMVLQVKNPTST